MSARRFIRDALLLADCPLSIPEIEHHIQSRGLVIKHKNLLQALYLMTRSG